jgi:hypothetical protein
VTVAAAAWLVSLLSLRSLHGLGSVAIDTVTSKEIDWAEAHVTTLFCCGLMYRSVWLSPLIWPTQHTGTRFSVARHLHLGMSTGQGRKSNL